jgi:subtilase family serine protease
MSRVLRLVSITALSMLGFGPSALAAPSANGVTHRHVCGPAAPGFARCHADVVTDAQGAPAVTATPSGYGPSDLRSAYALTATGSTSTTVAIVDAYDDPNAASDLTHYRSQYGLPTCATGCFTKVGQSGSSTALPRANGGWAQEISLDLDMVSAACPACKIRLVEGTSASFSDLGKAENTAAGLAGVKAVSNSYGGSDSRQVGAYRHPGIAITASTGDSGFGVQSPASFDSVIAVGGTSLRRDSSARGWHETAWNGAGSGCSALNAKPAWQTAATKCSGKASADVSAIADPNTGVAVYDSFADQGFSGWLVFGGTSASSPIIASVYAMSSHLPSFPASYTWAHPGGLNDVTSGRNGTCSPAVWCTSAKGWDGPTGLGTPKGTTAF